MDDKLRPGVCPPHTEDSGNSGGSGDSPGKGTSLTTPFPLDTVEEPKEGGRDQEPQRRTTYGKS